MQSISDLRRLYQPSAQRSLDKEVDHFAPAPGSLSCLAAGRAKRWLPCLRTYTT
jgi:hypothetical protein